MNAPSGPDWRGHTCCVRCGSALRWGSEHVQCFSCGLVFPVARGVPVLIDSETSVFDVATIAAATTTATERNGLRRFIPDISLNPRAEKRYEELARRLAARPGPQLVLVIGAGEGGRGIESLHGDDVELVRSDVAIGPTTDVCLDAHWVPFLDDTFDAVVSQAVLEHVISPPDCVREFARVLKPGGLVYAETPFMQQVHMGAHDFTRFTPLGHRRLFREFEEISSGVAVGPGSALAWALVYFFISFAVGRRSERVLGVLARFSFFWLKYFDLALNNRPASADAAAGVFFLGSLASRPIGDRDVLSYYRGGWRFRR